MRLSQYIIDNLETILQEFEDFARTQTQPGQSMDVATLRDHAAELLQTIARDLEQPIGEATEARESEGVPPDPGGPKTAAEHHGSDRWGSGFTINEIAAEFRALRTSVLQLWTRDGLLSDETAPQEIVRFNQEIDQALEESITEFSSGVERITKTAQIARSAIAEPKLKVLLRQVAKQVTDVLNVEYSRILEFLPDEGVLIVRAVSGFPAEQVDQHRVPVDDELEAWIKSDSVEQGQLMDVPNSPLPSEFDLDTRSGMSIAILTADGPWGVLEAYSATARKFGAGVLDFMRTVADILAASVERGAAEAQVRFQATLLDAVGDAVVALDPGGRVIYWNRQAERLFGWTEEEALDRTVVDLLATDARDRALDLLRNVFDGHEWTGEMRVLRKDATAVPLLAVLTPLRDEYGNVIGIVSASSDISERLQFDEELRQSQKMAALGRLAGGVAHDFNNLLTSIHGFTDLMLDELSEDAPTREFAQEVRGAARRATKLTAQLLAFSRRQAILPQLIDPRQVVMGMEKLLRRLIGEHIQINFRVEGRSARILADPALIEQVIMNLAVNARDAMPLGGILTISVDNRHLEATLQSGENQVPQGDYVVLSVEDDGSGISVDIRSQVFDPFFTTKAKDKGTGLGLSTVYGIVQQSGGTVLVESTEGRGTSFLVFLPEIEGENAEASREVEEEVGRPPGEGRTVLVAEDDMSVRALLSRLLPRLGFRVIEAANGEEAMKQYRQHEGQIDLVLTDVIMPHMSGPELARELERAHSQIPVIFMSGYTDDVLERQHFDVRFALLQKPFTAARLSQTLERALAARPEA